MARAFSLKTGDSLLLNFQDSQGNLRSENLLIEGTYNINSRGFQRVHVYVNQITWGKLYYQSEMPGPFFQRIIVNTTDLSPHARMIHAFAHFPVVVKAWKELNPEMSVVLEFTRGVIMLFMIILALTVTLTVLTPVRMLWEERISDFQMLSVLGV